MKKLLITIAMSLLYVATVSAQEFSCASDVIEQSMTTMYPEYAHDRAQLESFTQLRMNNTHARMLNFGCQPTVALYEIPVVVHIVHLGEPIGTGTNISDAQVQQGLDDANAFWIPQMGIKFVLAKTSPSGTATNGINRVNGSAIPNYASIGIDPSTNPIGAPDTTIKKLSIWSWLNYVNIWVVNKTAINAAYANMPGLYKYQGIVISYNVFGINSTGVCSHELGHYFNLYHTFQGSSGTVCASNNDPYNQGDKCPDTPPVLQSDCQSGSCGPFPNINNSLMNNMGYCYRDGSIFTPDQKTRTIAALSSEYRWGLVTSPGLIPTNVTTEVSVDSVGFEQDINLPLCNGWLTPKARFKNYGQTVNSMELMVSVNNSDTIFTIYPGLLRGSESLISLIPIKFTSSGINNIEVIVRKVNGVTDYNQLNNNLCIDVSVTVQTITVSTNVSIVGAGSITGSGNFSCNGINDTIRVTTNPGFIFQNIMEGSTIVSTVPMYVLPINLSQGNRVFTANFTVATYSVNATTNPTNGGTVTGAGTYNYGSTATVTFKSKAGYQLVNVTENGNIITTDSTVSIVSISANRNLVGNFSLKTFSVTTGSNGVGGTVSGGGSAAYGASMTLVANPSSCYDFISWTENGNFVSSNKSYTLTVTGNRNLIANFTQKRFLITAGVNNSALGSTTGQDFYGCGLTVTMRASVKPGGKWLNWTENGNIVDTDSVITFPAVGNRNLVANFVSVVTGIVNHSNAIDFVIFPNPTSNVLNIEFGSVGTYNAEMYNMVGDMLWSESLTKQKTVDVTGFAKGVYILKLDDGNTITSKQFIVQ